MPEHAVVRTNASQRQAPRRLDQELDVRHRLRGRKSSTLAVARDGRSPGLRPGSRTLLACASRVPAAECFANHLWSTAPLTMQTLTTLKAPAIMPSTHISRFGHRQQLC